MASIAAAGFSVSILYNCVNALNARNALFRCRFVQRIYPSPSPPSLPASLSWDCFLVYGDGRLADNRTEQCWWSQEANGRSSNPITFASAG